MRYSCTIFTDRTLATKTTTAGGTDADPAGDVPVGQVIVSGSNMREAAARAYVQCVGRERARRLREELQAPRRLARQETNYKAIAACLRKTSRSGSDCYLVDNFVESWYIHVEPVVNLPRPSSPRRLRLPHHLLSRLSRTPSPN